MKSKTQKINHFNQLASERDQWKKRNRYYYEDLEGFIASLIPAGKSVLEIGCGTGDLLFRIQPSRGLGLDFSIKMIKKAREKFPQNSHSNLEFIEADAEELRLKETFDYVVMSDVIGELSDIWTVFRNLKKVTRPESRLVITYFNALWEPILQIGEWLKLKRPQDNQNRLSLDDIENLLNLNGFETIKKSYRLLFPKKIPILSFILNKFLAKLPFIRQLCLVNYLIARPKQEISVPDDKYSVSVVVPCRNEKGNIKAAVERIPTMGRHTEIIFIDGKSTDGTVEEIEKVIEENKDKKDIKLIHQVTSGCRTTDSQNDLAHSRMLKLGKGDAVRKAFATASGDILMILDSDLTVPPEDLPKFYFALKEGHGEFINGTRLVYPMEKEAMRFLNKLGNKFFSLLFTWILDQKIKDTLCGTKVLFKTDYAKIAENRNFFGEFDPFGDFDLLFGAAKQNLKIIDLPIMYRERTYGAIKIQRFRHGIILLKMSVFAAFKLKFN